MSLVEIRCTNEECSGHERDVETGQILSYYQFLGNDVPASFTDPGYLQGECDVCGMEAEEYEVDRLGPDDIEHLRYASDPRI